MKWNLVSWLVALKVPEQIYLRSSTALSFFRNPDLLKINHWPCQCFFLEELISFCGTNLYHHTEENLNIFYLFPLYLRDGRHIYSRCTKVLWLLPKQFRWINTTTGKKYINIYIGFWDEPSLQRVCCWSFSQKTKAMQEITNTINIK